MAVEFILAVFSGLVVALLSKVFQDKQKQPDPIIEVTQRSEWILRKATFEDGHIVQESTETLIEQSTFHLPEPSKLSADQRIPVFAGILIFVLVNLLLWLV